MLKIALNILGGMRIGTRRKYGLAILAFFGLFLVSLGGWAQNNSSPKVIATFLPVYLFAKAVAGQNAGVEILIPPGSEVHEYQAKPADVQAIATADILVKNGLGLEEFLSQLISSAGNQKLKQIDASQGIQTIEDGNPHVWLDPVLAQKQVANIRDGLSAANQANASTYKANAEAYIKQLQALHQEFEKRLTPLRDCTFIAFHDAYPYLAKRYGLQQVAVLELPEDSMTPGDIARVVETAKRFKVKFLMTEPGADSQRLQQLATDLGLSVRSLDPLERGDLDPQYYFKAMRQNLQTLEAACR